MLGRLGEGNWYLGHEKNLTEGLSLTQMGPAESKVAQMTNGQKSINELKLESTLPEVEMLHVIYSLYCLGYLQAFSS